MELLAPLTLQKVSGQLNLTKLSLERLSKPPHNYIPDSGLGHIITYFLIEQFLAALQVTFSQVVTIGFLH